MTGPAAATPTSADYGTIRRNWPKRKRRRLGSDVEAEIAASILITSCRKMRWRWFPADSGMLVVRVGYLRVCHAVEAVVVAIAVVIVAGSLRSIVLCSGSDL